MPVRWVDSYNATDDPTGAGGRGGGGRGNYATDADLLPDSLRPNRTRELLGPGEHPFATKYATRTLALAEPIVVNCTGLGSYTLFNDKELVPVKGQLTALVPQPEVDYRASGRTPSGGNATMTSRADGIIVGNLQDPGNWSLEPDEEVRQRNVDAAIEFFSAMRAPKPGAPLTHSERPRAIPPVTAFFDAES